MNIPQMQEVLSDNSDDEFIDLASDWIGARNGAYLAKENIVVYYASITGRASDYQWHKLTLTEAARIIRASKLTLNSKLNINHIVAACQELGRVYDFGIKSNFEVSDNIFNYFKEANTSLEDSVMDLLSTQLFEDGYGALLKGQVDELFEGVLARLNGPRLSAVTRNQLMYKYFERYGYVIRIDKNRVKYKGKLTQAIMMVDKKPLDIVELEQHTWMNIRAKLLGALK